MFDPAHEGLIYFEDIRVGEPMTFGAHAVTAEAIKAFARRYDPQPIHLDETAAAASIVGGLCASGFHSCAIMMRMLCDHFLLRAASLGAPGLDYCHWKKPVRPGHILSIRIQATEKRVMASRPHVGLSQAIYDVVDQTGEVLLSSACPQMLRVRDPKPKPEPDPAARKGPAVSVASLWDETGPPAPADTIWFEDRRPGETIDLGAHTFDRDDMIAFARQFDPQPFHLDDDAAAASLFGKLAASGWHTVAVMGQLFVRERQRREAAIMAAGRSVATYGPSPGFKNLKWLKPVLVGDTLEYRTKVLEQQVLKSRPDKGILHSRTQARNQRGEIVYSYDGMILAERRTRGDTI
jgi:acyl dehydratase